MSNPKKHLFSTISLVLAITIVLAVLFPAILFSQTLQKIDSLQNQLVKGRLRGDSAAIAQNCYELGMVYYEAEKNFLASRFFDNALLFATPAQKPKITNMKGTICWRTGQYDEAMEWYHKELRISSEAGNQKYVAMALNNIGFIYAEYGEDAKTLEYYQKALEVRLKSNDIIGLRLSYNNLGRVYMQLDSLDKAMDYYNKALRLYGDTVNDRYKSTVLNNIGNLFLKQQKYEKAMDYYQRSLVIKRNINDLHLILEALKNIAHVHIETGNYAKARRVIEEGIPVAEQIESDKMRQIFYRQLHTISEVTGNYKEALNYYRKQAELGEELKSLESQNRIAELEVQYQTRERQQQIEFLGVKNALNQQIIQKQRSELILLFAGLALVVLILLAVLWLYYQRNRAYKKLVEQSIEIAHLEDKTAKPPDFEPQPQTNGNTGKLCEKIPNHDEITNKLSILIENEKFFLNPTCTIDAMAKKIGTNRQYLSQIINDKFQLTFTNFINTYRIKEARKLLLSEDHDKYTIETIAQLSGFNNRVTFSNAFKKVTGVTPSFFKKERKIKQAAKRNAGANVKSGKV